MQIGCQTDAQPRREPRRVLDPSGRSWDQDGSRGDVTHHPLNHSRCHVYWHVHQSRVVGDQHAVNTGGGKLAGCFVDTCAHQEGG
jgi:hypothetical protein